MTPTRVVFSSCIPDGRIQAGSFCFSAWLSCEDETEGNVKGENNEHDTEQERIRAAHHLRDGPFGSWPSVTA